MARTKKRKVCCAFKKSKSRLSPQLKRRELRKAYLRKRLKVLNAYNPKLPKERPSRSDVLRRLPMVELVLNLFLILLAWGMLFWCSLHLQNIKKPNSPKILHHFRGIASFTYILIMMLNVTIFLTGSFGCAISIYGMPKKVWAYYKGCVVVNMILIGFAVYFSVIQHVRPKSTWSIDHFFKHGKKMDDFGHECANGLNNTEAFVNCHDKIQGFFGAEKHGYVQMTLVLFIISVFVFPILLYLAELQGFVDSYHPLLFYYTTREKYRFQGINEPELLYKYIKAIPYNLRTNFEKQVLYWLGESFKTRQRLEHYGIRKANNKNDEIRKTDNKNDENKLELKGRDRIPARAISTTRGYNPRDSEGSGYNTPTPSEQKVIRKWNTLYDTTYHQKEHEEVTSYSLIMFRGIGDDERCALEFEIRKSDPDLSSSAMDSIDETD